MATVLELKVDVQALEGLSERLGDLDGDTLAAVAADTVNSSATYAYETTKKGMLAGLTLTDPYISRKMELNLATPSTRARATVVAKGLLTTLGHYGAVPLTTAVKNQSRSKGWAAVNVPKGQKQAGVSVEVTRGARATLKGAFVLPDLEDKEGNPLIFFRNKFGEVNPKTGRTKVESLLGPSVYQLFKEQFRLQQQGITDNLQETLLEQAEAAFKKVLE